MLDFLVIFCTAAIGTIIWWKIQQWLDNRPPREIFIRPKSAIRTREQNLKEAIRLKLMIATATSALGDEEAARRWLHRPQRGLGGRIPVDMIETEAGAKEVENLLGRIEHGVYS